MRRLFFEDKFTYYGCEGPFQKYKEPKVYNDLKCFNMDIHITLIKSFLLTRNFG